MTPSYTRHVCAVVALTILASGCEFFGKQVPKSPTGSGSESSLETVPGAYLGSWSYIDVSTSGTNTPSAAYVTRFDFSATTDSRFRYTSLVAGGPSIDLTGIAAFDAKLPAVLMALSQGTDPSGSYIGKTIQLASPSVTGTTLTYTTSSGTRYLYADPTLNVAPPTGAWTFGIPNLDFVVIAPTGYAVAQMRDENNDPVLVDAIARPDTDGSFTFEFFAVYPENSIGSIFFFSYALEPNGDLVLEDADGIYTGTKL